MRAYLPLTLDELLDMTPPARPVVTPAESDVLSSDDLEQAMEEAMESASFDSLHLAYHSDAAPCRVVAAGDVNDAKAGFTRWDQVQSLMVDGPSGRDLARQIARCENQDDADRLVERLFDQPLVWFDISEREKLAAESE